MSQYKTPEKTQSTNINNHRRLKDILSDDVTVEIFALPDGGLLHYGQFHLNLAAALEDDIIRVLDPQWNRGKEESKNELPETAAIEDASMPQAIGTFKFRLQQTYYGRGFFNVGVESQKFIGADGETIELFLGGELQPTLGTINRRANANGTPRIIGGTALRDWFTANASVMDNIDVIVLSPTSIRLISNNV